MKLINFTLLTLFITFNCLAQTNATFENFDLEPNTFLNGSDGINDLRSGNLVLINDYNADWDSWTGWAISNTTDTQTPGFTNQYSSITGSGFNNSETYATAFVLGESLAYTTDIAGGGTCEGFYINNSTYAFLSMLEGDAFAKKFGGEDGTDPDFFKLTIKEFGNRQVNNDSIDIYLADYRFDDNSEDYILNEWTYVDLSIFENVDTLSFTLSSSDNGAFGMNTPAYFCIDDFVTNDAALTANEITTTIDFTVYPNPATNYINIDSEDRLTAYSLTNQLGLTIKHEKLQKGNHRIDTQSIPSGLYILSIENDIKQKEAKKIYINRN